MDPTLIGVSAAAIAAAAGGMTYAVRGRSSSVFGQSVYRGDTSRPLIALTFDDGPSRSTPALLEILAQHRVQATFFMCGRNVRRYPEIARAVRKAGHEIGNHSDSHQYLYFRSREFIYRELALAQETIVRATGVQPRWFRAPYGVRWFGIDHAQARLGLTGVMWTSIAHDWKWSHCRTSRLLLQQASNGSIFCLHDGRGLQSAPDIRPTLRSVERIIPELKDRGYQFATLTETCPPRPRPEPEF